MSLYRELTLERSGDVVKHLPSETCLVISAPPLPFSVGQFLRDTADRKFLVWFPESSQEPTPYMWLIKTVLETPDCYLTATDDPEEMGPMFYCKKLREWGQASAIPWNMHAWISGKSECVTGTHIDHYNNLVCVLHGRKVFYLTKANLPHHKAADTDASDATPANTPGVWTRLELTPGKMLYITPGTWHYVESDPQTIMCSFLWNEKLNE
jgi:hypothetical protein